jgi:hypothetical protein
MWGKYLQIAIGVHRCPIGGKSIPHGGAVGFSGKFIWFCSNGSPFGGVYHTLIY